MKGPQMSSRMNVTRRILVGVVGLACPALLQGGVALAQSPVDFAVSGTSTIRGWTCTVSGTAEVTAGGGTSAPGFDAGVQTATLTVPVSDFECPNEEMLEAMRPDDFGEITFSLDGYEPSRQGAQATGELTILDTTQAVTFPLSLSPSGSGVQIAGEILLDMTTYGVEPPVVMLGLLKVRPQIRIEFEGLVTP